MADTKHKLKKYKQYLESYPDGDKVLSVLKKLDALSVSIALLQDTGIGKLINSFRKKPEPIGILAKSIVAKWKTIVTEEDKKTRTENEQPTEEEYSPEISKSEKHAVEYQPTPKDNDNLSDTEYNPSHADNENLSEAEYSPSHAGNGYNQTATADYTPSSKRSHEEYVPRSKSSQSRKEEYVPSSKSSHSRHEGYVPSSKSSHSKHEGYVPSSKSSHHKRDEYVPSSKNSHGKKKSSHGRREEYVPSSKSSHGKKEEYVPSSKSSYDKKEEYVPSSKSSHGKKEEYVPSSKSSHGKKEEYVPSSKSSHGKKEEYVPSSKSSHGKSEEYVPGSKSSHNTSEYVPRRKSSQKMEEYVPESENMLSTVEYVPGSKHGHTSDQKYASDSDEYTPHRLSPHSNRSASYSPARVGSEDDEDSYSPAAMGENTADKSDEEVYDAATPEGSDQQSSEEEEEEEYEPKKAIKESSKYPISYTPTPIAEEDGKSSKRHKSESSSYQSSSDSGRSKSDKHSSKSDRHGSKRDKHSSNSDRHSSHGDRHSSHSDKHRSDSDKHKHSSDSDKHKHSSYSDKHKHSSSSDKHNSHNNKHSTKNDKNSSKSDKHSSNDERSSHNYTSSSISPKKSINGGNRSSASDAKYSAIDKHSSASNKHSSASSDRKSSSSKPHSKTNMSKERRDGFSGKISHSNAKIRSSEKDSRKEKTSEKRKFNPIDDSLDLFSPDTGTIVKKAKKSTTSIPKESPNSKSSNSVSGDKRDSKKHSKEKSSSSSHAKSADGEKREKKRNKGGTTHEKGEKRKKEGVDKDVTAGFSFDDFLNCDVGVPKKKPRKDLTSSTGKAPGMKWSSSLTTSPKPSTSRQPKTDDIEISPPFPKQKVSIQEADILNHLPETNANYKPLRRVPEPKMDLATFDPMVIGTKQGKRTQVYSGKKHGMREMKSLFSQCIQVLIDNIDSIDYVGGIPYDILKPVLAKCSVNQLLRLEDLNPHFVGETEELWEIHCEKDFRNSEREEMESWRELYMRLQEEREAKLVKVRNMMNQQAAAKPKGRQVQLAYVDSYVKPPRDVLRKQQRYGTGKVVTASNSIRSSAQSGGSHSRYNPHVAVPAPRAVKPVAPMMQKINKLLAKRRR